MGSQAEGFIEQKKPSRKCTSAWSQSCLQKGTGCELWSISAFKQAFVTCFEAALNSLLHLLTGDHEADHEIRKASKSRLTYDHPPVLDSLDISLLLLRSVILVPDEVSHTVTRTVWCCATPSLPTCVVAVQLEKRSPYRPRLYDSILAVHLPLASAAQLGPRKRRAVS